MRNRVAGRRGARIGGRSKAGGRAAAGAFGLSLALLLAGCSSGASTADSSSSAAAGASSPAPTASLGGATTTPTPTPTPKATPSRSAAASAKPSAKPSPKASPTPPRTTTFVVAGRYTFPLRCTGFSYGHSHHDYPATDIFAPRGCLVVAPVSGVVDEVTRVDTWSSAVNSGATRGGLSFSIVGVDGVRYYGSHLESLDAAIRPGAHVTVGQPIGKVGNTGDARGITTHLHFGISWPTGPGVWWVRRGEVYPWPYLDAWRAGSMRSPAAAVAARHRQVGDGSCTVDC